MKPNSAAKNKLHPRPEVALGFFVMGAIGLAGGATALYFGAAGLESKQPLENFFLRWIWPLYFTVIGLQTLRFWWRYGIRHDFSYESWLNGHRIIYAGLGMLTAALAAHGAGLFTVYCYTLFYFCREGWHSPETKALFRSKQSLSADGLDQSVAQLK